MADNKINMPSSGGGLIRYFDDYKAKISWSPWVIMIIIAIIIVLLYVLYKSNVG